MNPLAANQFIRPTCLWVFSFCLLNAPDAWAANTIDPNSTGATDVVADPFGSPVLLANPLADPFNLPGDTLAIGNTAAGEMLIDAGSSVTTFRGEVGVSNGSTGSVSVSGSGSTWTTTDSMNVGRSGSGTLDVDSGATVTSQNDLTVGNTGGSSGAISVDDATLSVTDQFTVGRLGEGDATFQNDSQLSARRVIVGFDNQFAVGTPSLEVLSGSDMQVTGGGADLFAIAQAANSRGELTIDGTGSTLTSSLELKVGILGDGSFNVRNGGVADFTATGLQIAEGVGSTGAATVTGSGSMINATGDLFVGSAGMGTLSIQSGATVIADAGRIGNDPNSMGNAMVSGSGSNWMNSGQLLVGNAGTGTLTVESAALVTSVSGNIGNGTSAMGTATIRDPNSAWNMVTSLIVGSNGNGTLNIENGGSVSNTSSFIGNTSTGIGDVTVTGAGSTWTNVGFLYVGNSGTGTLNVQSGAAVSATVGRIGEATDSDGSLVVSGIGSTVDFSNSMVVGNFGDGTLLIENGGTVNNVQGRVGQQSVATGMVTITGAGSTLNNSADFIVGTDGTGTLLIENGGALSNTTGSLGADPTGHGTVTVTGSDPNGIGSTWTNTGTLYVGNSGTGTLNVENGASVSSDSSVLLAAEVGSVGTAVVTGSGSTLLVDDPLHIGSKGDGDLTVSSGASVSVAGRTWLSVFSGSSANLVVTGTGSSLTTTSELTVGWRDNANLTISDGAVVSVTDPSGSSIIGFESTGSGTATVTGFGSTWTNAGALYVGGGSSAAGGTGTLNVSNGGTVTSGSDLVLWNTGTINLDGGTIQTVSFDNSDGGTFNHTDGTLTVDGGTFDPGTSSYSIDDPNGNPTVQLINGASGTLSGILFVGEAGNGTLSIADTATVVAASGLSVGRENGSVGTMTQSGGTITVTGSGFIGWNSGSTGTATVTGPGSTWTNSSILFVGKSGTGTLNVQNGATVSAAEGQIGEELNSSGQATISDPNSTLTISGPMYVGNIGSGTLTVEAGGVVSSSFGIVGSAPNAVGTATIRDPNSAWNMSSSLILGGNGNGTLNIENGAAVTNVDGIISDSPLGVGEVSVTGTGSTWTNAGALYVGGDSSAAGSTATLNVNNGGTVTSGSDLVLWNTGTINLDGGTIQTVGFDNSDDGTFNHTDGTLTVDGGTFTPDPNAYTIDDPNGTPVVRLINGASGSIVGELNVGFAGNGEFHLESGSQFSNDDAYIARQAGSVGVVSVSGTDPNGIASTWTNTGDLYVGDGGNGTLNILDGGSVSSSSFVVVGGDPNSVGAVTVSGSGSSWNSDFLSIGFEGTGSLEILDGASVTSSGGSIARLASSNGGVTIRGSSSNWTSSSGLIVGSRGNGILDIQDGASVSSGSTSDISFDPNSLGIVTVSDPNSAWTISGELRVGRQGEGQLSIADGATVSNTNGYIGWDVGAIGEVSVAGPGSTLTNFGVLYVGYFGEGSMDVSMGGTVTSFSTTIGFDTGADGSVSLDGVGTNWTMTSNAFIGGSGNGSLTISGGAQVSNVVATIGANLGSTGIVTVDGVGSTWTNTNILTVGQSGTGGLQILDGGTVSADFTSTIGLFGSGTVVVDGAGSSFTTNGSLLEVGRQGQGSVVVSNGGSVDVGQLWLGSSNTSTARGTVVVEGTGSTVNVSGQAFIGGDPSFARGTGNLNVVNGGAFVATDLLKIWNTGQLNMAGGTINVGRLEFENTTLTGHGTINVIGYTDGDVAVTATGGTLTLNLNPTDSGNEFVPDSLVTNTGTLELVDPNANPFPLGQTTVLEGGALLVRNGAELEIGDTLSGYGIIVGNVTGSGYNQIESFPTGTVDFRGTLDVGADTATIYSSQQPTINGKLSFAGGSLSTTANNLMVGSAGIIEGYANLTGVNFVGAVGSVVRASGGTLSLGNSSAVNGFYSNGTLEVDDGASLVLLDWNDAVLESGSLVTLGNGSTLQADNGLTLDFGGNITGHGTVATPNNPATPFVNNGNIIGDDPNAPITLSGYVKGVGTLDNVVITGTDAPGFSPATVNRGSVIYDGVLEIELAGSTVGSFDQLNHILGAGIADLGGTLDVTLIDGYEPSDGDSFEIITASSILDTFDIESLPALDAGLEWLVEYLPTSVLLSVSASLPGDFDGNERVDAFDFLAWQRDTSLGNLADWEANYGTPTTANAAAVPEPSALALMLVALCLPLRRRIQS